MRTHYVATAVGVLSAGLIVSYLLLDKDQRAKLKEKIESYKLEFMEGNQTKQPSILDEAGIPDQISNADSAQIENAKMVSEGSQYGVNYYNEVREEENEKTEN